jgi:subtilisin family serine protease
MKRLSVYLSVVLCLIAGKVGAQQTFYYGYEEKIPITPSDKKAVVKLLQPGDGMEKIFKDHNVSSDNYVVSPLSTSLVEVEIKNNGKIKSLIDALTFSKTVHSIQPVFYTQEGDELGITDEIVANFNEQVALEQRDAVLSSLALKIKEDKKFYVVLSVEPGQDALQAANKLQESGLVIFSHPNFIIEMKRTAYYPNDPFFNMQYNLHNTGQVFNDGHTGTPDADVDAPEAWDISKGSAEIVIAVLDEGVTADHPDLPNARQRRLPGSNFAASFDGTSPNDPSPVGNGNHGNACAGIIAATQDNNEGITGIAPRCTIMPIRIPFGIGGVPSTIYADAINFAWRNGAHVLSNSWTMNSSNPNLVPLIREAIQNAVSFGRDGLGAVVTFAAGNTANLVSGMPGFVSFPSNVNIPQVITVGSSDRYDRQANYSPTSNPGSSMNQFVDIVAPSHKAYTSQIATENFEIWSIDIPGTAGWNSSSSVGLLPSSGINFQSYTGRMGGTSAATPLVSGIAALILTIDPGLTSQQVYNILTCSADDVGGYAYTSGISNEMGAGRVNAFNSIMSSCPGDYRITWSIGSASIIKYQAGNFIVASSTIESGANVDLKANNEVVLNPGFVSQAGTDTYIHLESCACGENLSDKSSGRMASGKSYQEKTIPVQNITPGSDETRDEIAIFPNPSTGLFTITVQQPKATETSISILDIYGREVKNVFSGEFRQKQFEVDLSDYSLGIYLVKVRTSLKTTTRKILLKQ